MNEPIEDVLRGLTRLIISNLSGAAHEQYFPCANPDDMDDRIKAGKKAAQRLRILRDEFENIVTGVL